MRLIKLEGELNGHKFSVKPESLKAIKVKKELEKEMKEWQEKNNKEFIDFMKKYDKELAKNDFDSLPNNIPDSNEWLEDEEFRAKRFSKMAHTCMEFKEKPPASLWKSDELEYGIINEAWDFFTGRRKVPMEGISAR